MSKKGTSERGSKAEEDKLKAVQKKTQEVADLTRVNIGTYTLYCIVGPSVRPYVRRLCYYVTHHITMDYYDHHMTHMI
jgi:hypothetical protein